jgi:capsid protein
MAIRAGELPPAPIDPQTGLSEWNKIEWSLPFFDWVDPKNQSEADQKDWLIGKNSLDAIIAMQGRKRDDVFQEKADDIAAAIKLATAINEKNPGTNVTWRDIINAGIPGQQTADNPKESTQGASRE